MSICRSAQVVLLALAFGFAASNSKADDQAERQWAQEALQTSKAQTPEQRERVLNIFKNAFELFQSGEFGAAERMFIRGLETDPANVAANFYLGEVLARQKKTDLAEKQYLRTKALAPESKEGALADDRLAVLASAKQAVANEARVYFFRVSHFVFGTSLHLTVRDAERGIQFLFPGNRSLLQEYKGPPGELVLNVESNRSPPRGPYKFELKPRSVSYIRVVNVFSGPPVELLSDEEGKKVLQEIKGSEAQ